MPELNYPAAPQPNAGLLTGNPAQTVGVLEGLQRLQILGQQAPALGQTPAANLTNTLIANETARMQQQQAARQMVNGYVANSLAGLENPSADDVHSTIVNAARMFPDIARQYPDVFNSTSDVLLNGPNIKKNAALLLNSTLSPAEISSGADIGVNPQTGQTVRGTVAQRNVAATQPGGIVTAPPSGTEASAAARNTDLMRAANYNQDIFPWQQALAKLKALGPGATAPGSEGRQALEEFVYGLTPQIAPYLGIDPSKIKNYSDLRKYLVQGMQQRAQNMGPHTNEGLSVATTGSPNVNINDMSVDELIKAQIILRRMEQAQIMGAAKSGPVNYTAEKARISGELDPRAFGMDLVDPGQVGAWQKTLKGNERRVFNISLQHAQNSNIYAGQ